MGLTICYRGILRNPNEIELLLGDVADICLEIGWRSMPIHRSNIMPAQGLMITPEGSEPIWLTFLANGRLYDPGHFLYTRHPEQEKVDEEKCKWNITKTQYAGMDTHMAIIKLFRYLSMKYFKEFELRDDSQYWETNDPLICLHHFDEMDRGMENLVEFIKTIGDTEEDAIESSAHLMDEVVLRRGGLGMSLN
jgi:hypothetical protein